MTRLSSCPPWCAEEHDGEEFPPHSSEMARVTTGCESSLSAMWVYVKQPITRPPSQPRVTVSPAGMDTGFVRVPARDALALAFLIEQLATATPKQHREAANAIRQATALITGGSEP
jgi:hypothetical protein